MTSIKTIQPTIKNNMQPHDEKYIDKQATISSCGKYRYDLKRRWNVSLPLCLWIMLNPSTADSSIDDPTIRRCMGFARTWGCGGMVVVNLFALRSTNPKLLYEHNYPVGCENDAYLKKWSKEIPLTMAGWGNHGLLKDRSNKVLSMLKDVGVKVNYLKLTKGGLPSHPLYLSSKLVPITFGS